jgi:predicted acylesterase/phospholipase RssA
MPNRPTYPGLLVLAAIMLAGCTTARQYPPLDLPASARLLEVAGTSASANSPGDPNIQLVSHKRQNVLVLSCGGANGAYTAGLLNGWTASGVRPAFDVVTGISTGALIAPFAFLGPDFDQTLARHAADLQPKDIYKKRFLPALLWADSLADSAPLKQRIADAITPELLAKVAHAHAQGRRLYVGTTDLDTRRLVVWDLGAIASSIDPGKLQLFRTVLLASASVPGVLPPVAINVEVNGGKYTELHADGGVNASLFLEPAMLGLGHNKGKEGSAVDTTVYVVVAGKLRPKVQPVERRLFPVAGDALHGILQSRLEGDLLKVYLLTRFAGAQFALTSVPDDAPDEQSSLAIDASVMRELFERGYRNGKEGTGWQATPPGLKPGDFSPPRGGTSFTLGEAASKKADSANSGSSGARLGAPDAAVQQFLERVNEDILRSPPP